MEQIYAKLNRDTAASVVIPMGYHKGKTLGQLALEKPKALEWYISSYGGPDTCSAQRQSSCWMRHWDRQAEETAKNNGRHTLRAVLMLKRSSPV